MKDHQYIFISRLLKSFVSLLLILCVSLTFLPFNLLHLHEEENSCRPGDADFEKDPCHLSLYHSDIAEANFCKHPRHLQAKPVQCDLCKYFSSGTSDCFPVHGWRIKQAAISKAVQWLINISADNSFHRLFFNRGPPACA